MVGEGGVGCMALKGIFSFVYFPSRIWKIEERERIGGREREQRGWHGKIWRAIETEERMRVLPK